MAACVALLLGCFGSAARAASPEATRPADPAAADTTTNAVADSTRQSWSEQPRFVMLRSLVVPGWGQFHNHAYLKALAAMAAEGWLLGGIFDDQHRLDRLQRKVEVLRHGTDQAALDRAINEYNDRLDRLVGGQWMLGGVLALALVDAYVDAHFRTFEIDFRTDPALPRESASGPTPPVSGSASAGSARLALRWHF